MRMATAGNWRRKRPHRPEARSPSSSATLSLSAEGHWARSRFSPRGRGLSGGFGVSCPSSLGLGFPPYELRQRLPLSALTGVAWDPMRKAHKVLWKVRS